MIYDLSGWRNLVCLARNLQEQDEGIGHDHAVQRNGQQFHHWDNLSCEPVRHFAMSQLYIWKIVGNAVVEWRVKELTFALKRISVWTTSQWPYWQACIKAVYIQLAEHMLRYTISTHLCHLISNKLNTGKSRNWAYLAPVIPKVDLNAGFKQ